METLAIVHEHHRLHNDLNLSNIILHFENEEDWNMKRVQPAIVLIKICDWGCASHREDGSTNSSITFPTHIAECREKYPHLAPELWSAKPLTFDFSGPHHKAEHS